MSPLGPHSVTVVRPASKPADYGSGTESDWTNSTTHTITGCSVQPAPADEFTIDRDTFLTRWQVFLPGDPDVKATDRIAWQGDTYEIDGSVQRWQFGSLTHAVLNLRRSEDG